MDRDLWARAAAGGAGGKFHGYVLPGGYNVAPSQILYRDHPKTWNDTEKTSMALAH